MNALSNMTIISTKTITQEFAVDDQSSLDLEDFDQDGFDRCIRTDQTDGMTYMLTFKEHGRLGRTVTHTHACSSIRHEQLFDIFLEFLTEAHETDAREEFASYLTSSPKLVERFQR